MAGEDLKRDLAEMHPASFAWALGQCGRKREEAEEVLQSSYLKVLDGRARFDGRSSLKAWFFAVVRKTAAEHRRRGFFRAMLARRLAASRPPEAGPADPETLAHGSRRRERLVAALSEIAARQRKVLELVFYHGLTIDEAAAAMGVSCGSARVHYERGKRRLREKLGTTCGTLEAG